ncbi:hypothetical protein SNE40_010882 [Patella caerulea]|uniref:Uncharacterized protein n=1 Tax=Patella caerulea TaxID=87958 RepID=A0AAN8JR82_PATCE
MLNAFGEYCTLWKLNVNINKTKVVIFGSRGQSNATFSLLNRDLEICDSYNYLGVVFSKGCSFAQAQQRIKNQASKALHLLYSRIHNLNLPIDCQLKLFDHTILPILLYGCEIWGFGDLSPIETIHNQFLRNILKVKKSTPLYMLYGETGRYPLSIYIKHRMVSFWIKMISGKVGKYSLLLYKSLLINDVNHTNKWLITIKNTLTDCGYSYVWNSQQTPNPVKLKYELLQRLKDQYIQTWSSNIQKSNKSINYRIYKTEFKLEPYLISLPDNYKYTFIRYRTCNHKLPVEVGRWMSVDFEQRICPLCEINTVGDEYHYLFDCTYFIKERENYIPRYYYTRPNTFKYNKLFNSSKRSIIVKLCMFLKIILNKFMSIN